MVRFAIAILFAASLFVANHPSAHGSEPTAPREISDAADDLKPQIAWAEAWGRAVFDAYRTTSKVSNLAMDTAVSTAINAIPDKCTHISYRAVIVTPPGTAADRFAVYYIGSVPGDQGLMIGRHYRVEVSSDGKNALSVKPSSGACLIQKPQAIGEGITGMVTTHTLTPAPSEFHVFLSLLTHEPLYVATNSGMWQVDAGHIQLLKAN